MTVAVGACALFESDQPATVIWVEARLASGVLQVRALGSAGCGKLTTFRGAIGTNDDIPVLELTARARPFDFECVTSAPFDTTLEFDVTADSLQIRSFLRGDRAREVVRVTVRRSTNALYAGGRAEIRLEADSCLHVLPLMPSFDRPVYELSAADAATL